MIEVLQLVRGLLTIKITGELRPADTGEFRTAFLQSLGKWGKIRILLILDDFAGTRFSGNESGVLNGNHEAIEKIAIVADKDSEEILQLCFGKGHPAPPIVCFRCEERERAVIWRTGWIESLLNGIESLKNCQSMCQ